MDGYHHYIGENYSNTVIIGRSETECGRFAPQTKYDHQVLEKPNGNAPIYRITYEDCTQMVGKMRDSFNTDVFGVEKEAGKVAGMLPIKCSEYKEINRFVRINCFV